MRSKLVYIAAPFSGREAAREMKRRLEQRGHVVTSTWIEAHTKQLSELRPIDCASEAQQDLQGIDRAGVVVFINNAGPSTSGGMHLEFGYALAKKKEILILGLPTSVFHYLTDIYHFSNPGALVDAV